MSATQVVLVAILAVAVLAALAAFSIASRRTTPDWRDELDGRALKSDRSKVPAVVGAEEEPLVESVPDLPVEEPATVQVVEVQRVEEVSPEEAGVTRRQFFNRATLALFGTFSLTMGGGMLAFMWPNLKGGFGSDIDAGTIDEIRTQVFQADGSITPLFRPDARAYIVPITDDELAASQFVDKGLAAGGFMALFQRCVHLGCRVPWCGTSQGFECPCHGSKYNYTGEYEAGPAPRNLDRFVVELSEDHFIIKTGQIIESPRAPMRSVSYPQGPSCIAIESAEG
ncbi:MAG: ubiquinol-cytochrome c reductase iron-sulfur subunit [Acidimicrobiia bacterium]|nr:ubiquinol-cytochrome c reductase iron-sulfur subunit [Acidimicrobiia bacterium]